MRVLTDPVEIRAFRKKQAKKILRMMCSELQSFLRSSYFSLRSALIQLSICSAFIALWFLSLAVFVYVGQFLLNSCTV